MRLQISTGLAIFAVLELAAREGRRLSVAEIGEKYGVSSHHLAKVMHVMGRAGLVRSVRGAGGGYQFAGNARRTTLLDVAQLFENLNSVEQDAGAADATLEGQALRGVLNEIDDIARLSDRSPSRRCVSSLTAAGQAAVGVRKRASGINRGSEKQ